LLRACGRHLHHEFITGMDSPWLSEDEGRENKPTYEQDRNYRDHHR
jgi:hypothetical protein